MTGPGAPGIVADPAQLPADFGIDIGRAGAGLVAGVVAGVNKLAARISETSRIVLCIEPAACNPRRQIVAVVIAGVRVEAIISIFVGLPLRRLTPISAPIATSSGTAPSLRILSAPR